ncbi:MAG: hypothetical protein ACRD28_04610 [Acidobacteriaceae bacterium]
MIRRWIRQLVRFFPVLVAVIALLYVGDWSVFKVRVAHGTAYSTVEVNQFLATKLKGNKTEYDLMGTAQETCARSIFPQKWLPPCWWLKRHNSQWE